MYRCLQLARLGAGNTAPNPMVGALLVYENSIIGEGYHQQYGQAHAEVNCINSVTAADKKLVEKSTLYVSLEPCSHFGKTPPCADLIIKNKIPNVIIGCRDSYTEVDGRGIEKLKTAGINTIVGVLEKEALELNKRFFTFHQLQRPFIILKWAQTADEQIAGKEDERIFITNAFTNRLVHQWRSEEAAILVGTTTALKDDPALTTRLYTGKDPVRLVIDRNNRLPSSLKLFDGKTKTIVFNEEREAAGAMLSYYKIRKGEDSIKQVLKKLYELKIQSVIIEGGAGILQSFIDDNIWDEATVITNTNMTIGEGIAAPLLQDQIATATENIGTDKIQYFINNKR